MSFFFFFSVGVAIILFLVFVLSKRSSSNKLSAKLPPGNNGWPILGETLDYASRPDKFIHDRMKKHSTDMFQTSIGLEKVVFICGPQANKFLYSNESKFRMWLPQSMAKALSLIDTDRRTQSCEFFIDQTHKFLRLQSIQDYVPIMDAKTRNHLEKYWVPYKEVKVHHLAKEFTFSLACNLLINCKGDDATRELAEPFYILTERIISLPINLPGTSYNQALKASKVVQGKIIDLIKKRKEELLLKVDVDGLQDLLSRVLMNFDLDKDGNFISNEELAGQIISVLFASFHPTSSAITFVLSHLAENPDVYEKVLQEQLEITQSKNKGELLNWNEIQKMTYSWNVVRESIRLRPPTIGGFREALTDISYAGFTIPKGWKVHWNVYSTHMDEEYFSNPKEFDPTRFEQNFTPRAFVPFGGGPNMCSGREYARIETLVYLRNVVTRFRLSKINPHENIIFKPHPIPIQGLLMRLHPHQE